MDHQGDTLKLTPRGRGGGLGGCRGDSGILTACGPNLFRFGHAVFEVGVDFGDFGLGDHCCGCLVVVALLTVSSLPTTADALKKLSW